MTRLASTFRTALTGTCLVASAALMLACDDVTTVPPTDAIDVQAQPPGPLIADLPPVPQPPPPPRVWTEGELVVLDEALSFDEAGQLEGGHEDILAALATWLAEHAEVAQLSVEVHSIGKGSRRAHQTRSQALAQQIVDALIAEGIEASRLVAASVGQSEDQQRHVNLRVITPESD